MKNECSIIRDLLPLYSEGMVSEETKVFVKEHLKNCPKCTSVLDAITHPNEIDTIYTENNTPYKSEISPIKTIKRKLRKKKIFIAITAVFLTIVAICGFIEFQPASIDYGHSEIYSKEDMDIAIGMIKEKINSWSGCKLYSIAYGGDEWGEENIKYCNDLAEDGTVYTQCMVFHTCFRSPIFGGGAWNANDIYYYNWSLARTPNGSWQLLSWGYG